MAAMVVKSFLTSRLFPLNATSTFIDTNTLDTINTNTWGQTCRICIKSVNTSRLTLSIVGSELVVFDDAVSDERLDDRQGATEIKGAGSHEIRCSMCLYGDSPRNLDTIILNTAM